MMARPERWRERCALISFGVADWLLVREIGVSQTATDIEGTPVAIALIAVAGIIFIAYSLMEPENKWLAIMALVQLAGCLTGSTAVWTKAKKCWA